MEQKPEVQVKSILSRLRKGYKENSNRSYNDRVRNLTSLRRAIEIFTPQIHEAVLHDLGRNGFLTSLTETDGIKDTIDYYLSNLASFMKEDPRDVPALFAPSKAYVKYDPFGTALVIGSWNFPFSTTIHPVVCAIAAGNTVCIKPSEMAANSSALMKSIFDTLDKGVFGAIEGGPEIAIALLKERWDLIVFTGSPEKGKLIAEAAAKHLTPVVLELGGKNPAIIDKDANIDNACKRITQGRYLNAGQLCISPDMVLVHSSRLDEFLQGMKNTITEFFGKDPKTSKDYARIINDMHTKRIANLLQGHKGTVVVGGEIDFSERYIAPTVVLKPELNSPLGSQEVFGPILVVYPYNDLEECIELINSREKPLALYYFGANKKNMQTIKENTSSGNITWNDCIFHYNCCDLPFGGVGTSGISKMFGIEGFRAMSHSKSVLERNTMNQYPSNLRYPPYPEANQKTFFRLKNLASFTQGQAARFLKRVAVAGFISYLWYKGDLQPLIEGVVGTGSNLAAHLKGFADSAIGIFYTPKI